MKKIAFLLALAVFFTQPFFSQDAQWNEKWQKKPGQKSSISEKIVERNYKPVSFSWKKGSASFEIGTGVQSITAERSVQNFEMNAYETTYELWYEVLTKARKLGYNFQNPGQEGSMGRRGKAPKPNLAGQSVTNISWYDAIVWCNAFSELSNLTPCYTYKGQVIRDSSDTSACDLATCNWNANGYRLPTEAEWEFASRLNKNPETGENFMNSGNTISGQLQFSTEEGPDLVAWTSDNTTRSMTVGTAGTVFQEDAPPAMGSGKPNESGIFDMSGNMMEYCWDWFADYTLQQGTVAAGPEFGSKRISRGGSWSIYTPFYYCADRYSYDPNEYYNYMGFRLAKKGEL